MRIVYQPDGGSLVASLGIVYRVDGASLVAVVAVPGWLPGGRPSCVRAFPHPSGAPWWLPGGSLVAPWWLPSGMHILFSSGACRGLDTG